MILPILLYRSSFPYQLIRLNELNMKITSVPSFDVACVGAGGSLCEDSPLGAKKLGPAEFSHDAKAWCSWLIHLAEGTLLLQALP